MTEKAFLITRPLHEDNELADALHSRGLRTIHEPLIHIMLQHHMRAALEHAIHAEPDAVIATSRHGIEALALLSEIRDLPVLCVGEATARKAESYGFTRVMSGGGSAMKLGEYILSAYDEDSRLLYVSAKEISTDIEAIVSANNIHMQRMVLYEAHAVSSLSDILIEHIKRDHIQAVTLLSKYTAEIWSQLIQKASLTPHLATMNCFCLSPNIAKAVETLGFRNVIHSKEPILASLLESVDNALL